MAEVADVRLPLGRPPGRTVRGNGPEVVDVPVHYRRTGEGTWSYRVDNPSILGGGHATLEEAERAAVAALVRALGGRLHHAEEGERTGYLVVTLRAAVSPSTAAGTNGPRHG